IDYFNEQNFEFEEFDKYYLLDSHFVNLDNEDINKVLNNVVLSGAKDIVKVTFKAIGNEHYIEVIGLDLDKLFKEEYIDKERSTYLVYANSFNIDFELRKKNILKQLIKIVNADITSYNMQHIELLTNFMCRDNTITPMSRFGMRNGDYSFISRLSFEDPFRVIQDVFYGVKDDLTSISSKLITGIYNDEEEKNE
ncbi:hypothetical protein BCR36DRAFT_249689, partial [Piromyces finnis]